eukprot:NODE_787_length_3895_cov_0.922813.p1 type:complete len:308 gc:universal NODE_787_length_3895_cov_0.922813:1974-1051(-)
MTDECGFESSESYDLGLHIGGIFIIMGISFTGTILPMILNSVFKTEQGKTALQYIKLFGCGVILSTAFIHMLVPAIEAFQSPCLPKEFKNYAAYGGVMVLAGIFTTHVIQVVAAYFIEDETPDIPEDRLDEEVLDHEGHVHYPMLKSHNTQNLTIYLLELGIATHSVIIGIALGVAGPQFASLLVALSFHQFFEGMALSAIVTSAHFGKSWIKFFMIAVYSLTTPTGIAIGVGIHESFNANSESSLVSQAVLESFTSGILIYDALVNILSPHFKRVDTKALPILNQTIQFFALWLGAALMAIIGIWA